VIVDGDKTAYIEHLLGYVDCAALRPLTIVADPGNGGAGPTMRLLAERLAPLEFVLINEAPDGHFPNGVPNPLLPERRAATAAAVREHGPTSASPGTATSTAASCSTPTGVSSRGTTWWACSRR
jgi:phosphomannomutase / phosphoglucomutase